MRVLHFHLLRPWLRKIILIEYMSCVVWPCSIGFFGFKYGYKRLLLLSIDLPAYNPRHSKSNPIELNFNRTQSNSIRGLSSIEFGNRTKSNSHKNCTIELNRTFDFRTFDFCTTQWCLKSTSSWSYFGIPGSIARGFRKRRNSREMASDAPWVV